MKKHTYSDCRHQPIDCGDIHKGDSDDVKWQGLKMYVNSMGFRTIEQVTSIHRTTTISRRKLVGQLLPDAYGPESLPEVAELDELETFVDSRKQDSTAGGCQPLLRRNFRLGDHSAETLRPSWVIMVGLIVEIILSSRRI